MEKIVLGIVLVICVMYDHRYHKIPNLLCGAGAFTGCLLQYYLTGREGMVDGIFYAAGIAAVLFPLWFWKVLGGGDVKLMMVCGIFVKENIFIFLLFASCCTAVLSLILMLKRRNFWDRMMLFISHIRSCIIDGTIESYPFDKENALDLRSGGVLVSYGITAGYILWILTRI